VARTKRVRTDYPESCDCEVPPLWPLALSGGRVGYLLKLRSSNYLNNLIEQDHRGIKLRIGPMPRFKRFRTAAITRRHRSASPDP
jgi:transposase-like protein